MPSPAPTRAFARRGGPAVLAALALLGTAAARVPVPGVPVAAPGTHGSAAAGSATAASGTVAPPRKLLRADVLIVSHASLPASAAATVARLHGVRAARAVDAARVQVNGKYVAMLGVNPSTFRDFAAGPTASSGRLWQSVASGGIAVSYTMGKQDKLPLGGTVRVAGRTAASLRVGGYGTVGISGVDAVVSTGVARSLGFPAGNAIVVSAPHAQIAALVGQIKARMPRGALVEPLVTTAASGRPAAAGVVGSSTGSSGSAGPGSSAGAGSAGSGQGGAALSTAQLVAMLKAAIGRAGMPYAWGAAGPASFDCSGLVQWSFAQAGVVMPRVAADQARTGPAVPLSQAQPGDLLFYRTDPTAPEYISHVAIYLGRGLMIQAPQPGQNVQIVPVWLGSEFAGVVRVSPAIAAQVAASPVG